MRKPEQESGNGPAKDGEDVPAGPEDTNMALADEPATVRGDDLPISHTAKDHVFTEHRMRKSNEEGDDGSGNQECIH